MKIIKKIMRFTLQHNFLWQCSNQFQLLHTFRKKTQFKFALARLSAQKIERSPMHWTCKIQGAQHIICIKKLRFSSHPRANVRHQEPLGSTRTKPWLQKKKNFTHFIWSRNWAMSINSCNLQGKQEITYKWNAGSFWR